MTGSLDWQAAYPPGETHDGSSHVRMNFVASADGAVTLDNKSGGLGGTNDRELMAILRSQSDVVLVGAGTVREEGYGGLNLPSTLQEQRQRAALTPTPRIAIVSGSLQLSPSDPVFAQAETRPIVITHAAASARKRQELSAVADVIVAGSQAVDLADALAKLRSAGLRRVLCEGGPGLFGSVLEAGLVDELCLTLSPVLTAGSAGRIAKSHSAHPTPMVLASILHDDEGFAFLRYKKASAQ